MKINPIIHSSDLTINRPKPLVEDIPVLEYSKQIDPKYAVEALLEGNHVLIADQFSSGTLVLEALKKKLSTKSTNDSFQGQRNYREEYRNASQLLLIEISDHKLHVRKAPQIGWLKILYPEIPDFFLPFTDVQGLNSSWQWYEKGIRIPGLKQTLHPFYGTYFPTRFEHIELFVSYLKKYSGKKEKAFDVGIGSGILSKLLHQYGFQEVHASDINPNALIGMFESQKDSELQTKLYFGDLFAGSQVKSDLVVFNPPWVPLPKEVSGIDLAIYYDTELFPRFFEEAHKHLNPEGNLVLLFSNLAGLMNPNFVHPIEQELKRHKRFILVEKKTKKAAAASLKTKRKASWRDQEFVECWVLKSSK
ncbi:MAG: polypeptide chain release factor methylase [Fluviicola sp.]|uniref:methyltransferase n=1 Tax=Fluviicola sp. TaxID=1917219 RepID=UPI002616BA02|nr:methyltransferase [Fluviicola sp.]MDF3025952.1 polypeptide chain release factor methylase [Fluviicola sp.]